MTETQTKRTYAEIHITSTREELIGGPNDKVLEAMIKEGIEYIGEEVTPERINSIREMYRIAIKLGGGDNVVLNGRALGGNLAVHEKMCAINLVCFTVFYSKKEKKMAAAVIKGAAKLKFKHFNAAGMDVAQSFRELAINNWIAESKLARVGVSKVGG